MKTAYSIPKVNKTGKYWYIHFRYDGKQERISKFPPLLLNLNPNPIEKEKEFEILRQAYHEKLKEGWIPNAPEEAENTKMNIIEGIDFALKQKKAKRSPKTYADYDSTMKYVKLAIKELKYQNLEITKVKRAHIKSLLEETVNVKEKEYSRDPKSKIKKVSNNSRNKILNHISAIMDELMEWELIESNPVSKITRFDEEESIRHNPGTEQEVKTIISELTAKHYNFYIYVSLINYWGIRPAEILNIQLSDVDMKKGIVTLKPRQTKGKKKYRVLPIIDFIKEDFIKMNFARLPKEYYLFGSYREAGQGNRGQGQFSSDFIPAPTKLSRDTATKKWNTIVKQKLGIDITMYSMKKYGANQKLEAGISVDAIQSTFGHSDKEMTAIYLTKQNEISRQEITKKTPKL